MRKDTPSGRSGERHETGPRVAALVGRVGHAAQLQLFPIVDGVGGDDMRRRDLTSRMEQLLDPSELVARLHELRIIADRLAWFERIDETVGDVLMSISRSLGLHAAVLVLAAESDDAESRGQVLVWSLRGADRTEFNRIGSRALSAFEYIAGSAARRDVVKQGVEALAYRAAGWLADRVVPDLAGDAARINVTSLPLLVDRGAIFGVLQLETHGAIDEADLLHVDTVASQLSVALARHRALRREQAAREFAEMAVRQLRGLRDVSDAALRADTLQDLLAELADAIRATFAADAVGVTVFRPDTSGPRVSHLLGFDAADASVGPSLGLDAAWRDETVWRSLSSPDGFGPVGGRPPFRTLIGSHLWLGGRDTGVVWLASRASDHFDDDDVRALQVIAGRVAIQIEHARLRDRDHAWSDSLAAIDAASRRISVLAMSCGGDMGPLLRAIVDEARTVGKASAAALSLNEGEGSLRAAWVVSGTASSEVSSWVAATRNRRTISVPVRHGDSVLGVLSVACDVVPDLTDRLIEMMLTIFAANVAVAIENARLGHAMQRAIRARDDVLATVSHDLKSPLTSILLTLTSTLDAPENGNALTLRRSQVEALTRTARRMSTLIYQLLDAAAIENSAFVVEPTPCDLVPIAHETLESMQPLAQSKHVLLSSAMPQLPSVWCDRARIGQVLSNLVGNAIKFTPPGGSVMLAAEIADEAVRVTVRDTGCGISESAIPHLTDRYWRASRADRRSSGLGLYIANAIVAAHGGELSIESTPGEGSAFHFTVPIANMFPA